MAESSLATRSNSGSVAIISCGRDCGDRFFYAHQSARTLLVWRASAFLAYRYIFHWLSGLLAGVCRFITLHALFSAFPVMR